MITTKIQKPLTAIETLKRELSATLIEQMLCVDDWGIVIPSARYRYQQLTTLAKTMHESIDYLQGLKEGR